MEFYKNQKEGIQPVDFCTSSVDRIWEMTRKRYEERANRKRNENADFSTISMEDYECGESESDNQHEEYSQPPKKTKYEFIDEQLDQPSDKMPAEYRHIRKGQRSVRPEIYIQSSQNFSQNCTCQIGKLKVQLSQSAMNCLGGVGKPMTKADQVTVIPYLL